MMNLKSYWQTLCGTAQEFVEDEALSLAAALAYYSVFSIAPLLLIATSVAGAIFGDEAVRGELHGYLQGSLGEKGAAVVQDMVAHAREPGQNVVMSLVGVVLLLIGAGGVFGQLQDSLNAVWGVEPIPGRAIGRIVRTRFLSFGMVLVSGFLLLVSMILTTSLQAVSTTVGSIANLPVELWAALGDGMTFGVIVLLFAAIFKILPDARVEWRDVWSGSIFTAVLFVLGKFVLGWYLGREATASSYGPAGALALVLLWVHYSSVILLFGAEFTQVRAKARGFAIRPSLGARMRYKRPGDGREAS